MRIKKDKFFIDKRLKDGANTFQNSYFIVLFSPILTYCPLYSLESLAYYS